MRLNFEIVCLGSKPLPDMESFVFAEARKIEQAFGRMKAWRVILDAPERRHPHTGPLFNVMIQVTAPSGDEIVIQEHPTELEAHDDRYRSISDAFDALRGSLQDSMR